MAKHIDVEILKSAMLENINIMAKVLGEKNADSYVSVNHVIDLIDGLPAADVQEVRHGHWKKRMSTPSSLKCSNCGNSHEYNTTYCPWCGARMDGEEGGKP